jgi:hypothetical protein
VVLDGDQFYFLAGGAGFPGQIFGVSKGGGDATVVFDEPGSSSSYIGSFTARDGAIYMCRHHGPPAEVRVERFVPGDTKTQLLTTLTGATQCPAIALDETRAYVATDLPSPSIHSLPLSGGPTSAFTDGGTPYNLAVDAGFLYFTGSRGFARIPLDGGTVESLGTASPDIGLPTLSAAGGRAAMIGDGTTIDVIDGATAGSVGHFEGQNAAFTIVTDGTITFWGRDEIETTTERWPPQPAQLWASDGSSAYAVRSDLYGAAAYLILDADYLYAYETEGPNGSGIYRMKRPN